MRAIRVPALIMVLCMVSVACGARLTDEQRAFVIEGGVVGATGADGETTGGIAAPTTTGDATTTGTATSGTTGSSAPGTTTTGAAGTTGTTGATTGGAATTGGGTGGGAATTGGGTTGGGATTGGGSGGATSGGSTGGQAACGTSVASGPEGTGVTDDQIVIANASDISGAVQGLFKDAQLATKAFFAMINATEGGVCGRQIKLLELDARLDSNGNRNAYQTACEQAFAAVGSMSAFEQGAAEPIRTCPGGGLPDLRTAAVNKTMQQTPTVFSADSMSPGWQPLSEYNYWATKADVTRAGFFYIAAETTAYQVRELVVPGTEKGAGYKWPVIREIDISENNYAPFVLEMKNPPDGGPPLDFVAFQGAWQQALKLADAMAQQGFAPSVYALQSNVYTPDLFQQDRRGSMQATNTYIAVPSVILEELDRHPELQLYAQWLNQVAPGSRPTGLGIYSWSASRLFVDLLKTMPELSRPALVEKIKGVNGFEGNGLIPPQPVGSKKPADCVIIVQPKDGKFVRVEPAGQGLRCDNDVVQIPIK